MKTETGNLYLAEGDCVEVRPANGKKFTYDELAVAVGGMIESMVPAIARRKVWVNEEGTLKGLPLNRHTWTFADRSTYVVFNGYPPSWKVRGNALEIYKTEFTDLLGDQPTIAAALRQQEASK